MFEEDRDIFFQRVGPRISVASSTPYASEKVLHYALRCFPHASPVLAWGVRKQKTAPQDHSKQLFFLRQFGAGEGIRTLDPNLGKVVLYP